VGTKKNDADKDDADEDKSSDDQDIDSTFLEGEEALQRRDSTRAQEAFEKVIAKQPKYKGAHYDLAQALAGQNKLSEALTELHKEEENSPDDSRVYQTAAVLDNFSGRKDDAIGEWRKLLAVDPSNHDAALSLSRLLYQDGKYSEASEALEPAVKAAPDSPSLQLALGDAYLKSGQAEKAIPHLREAVKQGASDPTVLNDVAYSLAEGHTNLDLAKEYGEKALSALEEESQDSSAPDEMSMQVAYRLAMLWDTLGWVYFQRGEMTRAESFVRASWLLAQKGIVGEHLGEIYEKAGKNKAAAEVYAQALAAVGAMPPLVRAMTNSSGHPIAPSSAFEESDKQAAEITSRYQKLTGKKPTLNETVRLPNGEWTKTPGEQLSQMRTAKFGKQAKLSGSAQFTIVFLPGKIGSVEYVSGDKSLKALTEKIRAAHYNVEFPEGSEARLLRRAQLSCFPSSGCMAVLMPVENPGARFGPPQ
jgi:tetratricopeptide (TPR) repeat protein